ncbi:hypothetical protein EDB89DRAFT_1903313 [Lactarius sanguifluus]|nr:hypothetical protein EDB89DRAFT_1903313 [Lactarius sanguifluus]
MGWADFHVAKGKGGGHILACGKTRWQDFARLKGVAAAGAVGAVMVGVEASDKGSAAEEVLVYGQHGEARRGGPDAALALARVESSGGLICGMGRTTAHHAVPKCTQALLLAPHRRDWRNIADPLVHASSPTYQQRRYPDAPPIRHGATLLSSDYLSLPAAAQRCNPDTTPTVPTSTSPTTPALYAPARAPTQCTRPYDRQPVVTPHSISTTSPPHPTTHKPCRGATNDPACKTPPPHPNTTRKPHGDRIPAVAQDHDPPPRRPNPATLNPPPRTPTRHSRAVANPPAQRPNKTRKTLLRLPTLRHAAPTFLQ